MVLHFRNNLYSPKLSICLWIDLVSVALKINPRLESIAAPRIVDCCEVTLSLNGAEYTY